MVLKAHIRNPLGVAALDTINPEMVRLLLDGGAFDPTDDGKTLDRLATTVFKCAVYKPNGDSTKRKLRDIESMLLLAGIARCEREGLYEQDPESERRESCCQKIMRLCSRFPHHSFS